MNFNSVGRSTGTDGGVGSFLLQLLDVFLGRVRDNTFDNVTNHGQGNTDGGDDLGVLGDGVLQAHLLGAVGDQRGSTAAAANQLHGVVVQLILVSQGVDAGVDLLEVLVQDLGSQLLNGDAQLVSNGLHALAGSAGVAVCEVLLVDQAQHVGSVGVGEADTLAACQFDGNVVRGVTRLRAQHLDGQRAGVDLLLRSEAGVLAASDVGGTGADVLNAMVVDTDHGTTGAAQDADIQRVDVGIVAADLGVVNAGTAVLDNTDVSGGAADLKVDGVRSTQIHQGAHDGSSRAGQSSQDGTLTHLADLHNAAVAAHDHQGNGNASVADRALGGVCGSHHLGQNGSVDGGSAGTAGQAVQLGDVRSHGNRQALGLGQVMDLDLFVHVVNAESHGGNDNLAAFTAQLFDGGIDLLVGHFLLLQEPVMHGDLTADLLVQDDVLQVQLALCQEAFQTAACNTDDTDRSNVALDEGVGCLGGGVRNEDDVLRGNVVLGHAVFEGLHNAGGNAVLVVVGGLNFVFANDLMGQVVHGDTLGVSTADVNAHANSAMFCHSVFLLNVSQ